jgi:hypothetical protein
MLDADPVGNASGIAKVEPVRAFLFAFDAPKFSSVDPWALLLSMGAAVAIFRFKVGMIPTLAACSLAGMVLFYGGCCRDVELSNSRGCIHVHTARRLSRAIDKPKVF